jgi:hypothetical protein
METNETDNLLNNEDDYAGIDYYNSDFETFDDEYKSSLKKSEPKKKPKEKEYYVKGADLIAEIKKYHESKKADAEARRSSIGRTVEEKFLKN